MRLMFRGGCLPGRGSKGMEWKYDDDLCVCVGQKKQRSMLLFRVPARMVVRRPAPINQLFNDESIAVQI